MSKRGVPDYKRSTALTYQQMMLVGRELNEAGGAFVKVLQPSGTSRGRRVVGEVMLQQPRSRKVEVWWRTDTGFKYMYNNKTTRTPQSVWKSHSR